MIARKSKIKTYKIIYLGFSMASVFLTAYLLYGDYIGINVIGFFHLSYLLLTLLLVPMLILCIKLCSLITNHRYRNLKRIFVCLPLLGNTYGLYWTLLMVWEATVFLRARG